MSELPLKIPKEIVAKINGSIASYMSVIHLLPHSGYKEYVRMKIEEEKDEARRKMYEELGANPDGSTRTSPTTDELSLLWLSLSELNISINKTPADRGFRRTEGSIVEDGASAQKSTDLSSG